MTKIHHEGGPEKGSQEPNCSNSFNRDQIGRTVAPEIEMACGIDPLNICDSSVAGVQKTLKLVLLDLSHGEVPSNFSNL